MQARAASNLGEIRKAYTVKSVDILHFRVLYVYSCSALTLTVQ